MIQIIREWLAIGCLIGGAFSVVDGRAEDCNENGIPDDVDIEDGFSPDCNGNGVPDECDLDPPSIQVFYDSGANMSQWGSDWGYEGEVSISGEYSLSQPTSIEFDGECGLAFESNDISSYYSATLSYDVRNVDTEPGDDLLVEFWNGVEFQLLYTHLGAAPDALDWLHNELSLPQEALNPGFQLSFSSFGSSLGDRWYVDDVTVNANLIPPDCNANLVPDECDIDGGISEDADINGIPDECTPIIYVDAGAQGANSGNSWEDAYTVLYAALIRAEIINLPGTQIWVAEGSYAPTIPGGSRTTSFVIPSNVEIYGGFSGTESEQSRRDWEAHPTVLSGDLNGDDDSGGVSENSFHVVDASFTNAATRLDGFVLTAGRADGSYPYNVGAGLYVEGGRLTIANCKVISNSSPSAYSGGGLYANYSTLSIIDTEISNNLNGGLYSASGQLTVERSSFTANSGGGAVSCYYGSGQFIDCVFDSNSFGAFSSNDGSHDFSGCIFRDNSATYDGGAIYNNYTSSSAITSCAFVGNSASQSGGAILNEGWAAITNCVFLGNTAGQWGGGVSSSGWETGLELTGSVFGGNIAGEGGGGAFLQNSYGSDTYTVSNCTFANNFATEKGGGLDISLDPENGAQLTVPITNSILWGNTAGLSDLLSQISNDEATVTVAHSCIQNGWEGIGNFNSNPLFTLPMGMDGVSGTEDDNFGLMAGSIAIDTGDNGAAAGLVLDAAGGARFVDGDGNGSSIVDIGGYEYQADCNENGVKDATDIANGASTDNLPSEGDGFPDECQNDCNANGQPDSDDLYSSAESDCNANAVPDSCDIEAYTSEDADENGVPDECEIDCERVTQLIGIDTTEGDYFGARVQVEGPLAIVGAGEWHEYNYPWFYRVGFAYVFRFDGLTWQLEQKLDGAFAESFGPAVDVFGDVAVIGSSGEYISCMTCNPTASTAQVFRFDPSDSSWNLEATLIPDDATLEGVEAFGTSVSVYGDWVLIHAAYSGQVYAYHYDASSSDLWVLEDKLEIGSGSLYGSSVSISENVAIIGSSYSSDPAAGYADVYRLDGSRWEFEQQLTPGSGDAFGYAVSTWQDLAVIGDPSADVHGEDAGAAYVYRFDGLVWVEEAELTPSEVSAGDSFGSTVSVANNRILVGAPQDDDAGIDAGAAYEFETIDDEWVVTEKILAEEAATSDQFAYSVALNDVSAVIGSPYADDFGEFSGSAYVVDVGPLSGACYCIADTNGDGLVDPIDSGRILAAFGLNDPLSLELYDVNRDGAIDPLDSGFVLSRFGECP